MINLTTGQTIKAQNIKDEFGPATNMQLGAYRVNANPGGYLTNLPLDQGIPKSGAIKFSDFYQKKLNVIVIGYASDGYRRHALNRYNQSTGTYIVGQFKTTPPASGVGSRVMIDLGNTKTGSDLGAITNVALRMGTGWQTYNGLLELYIGSGGGIYGAGGNGGNGGSAGRQGASGQFGSSALGIEYPTQIWNYGNIISGHGGGGGGGGAYGRRCGQTQKGCDQCNDTYFSQSGGGGGGGFGFPLGQPGQGSTDGQVGVLSTDLNTGTLQAADGGGGGGGSSGGGGSCQVGAIGGSGGGGGAPTGGAGGDGQGSSTQGQGGAGGQAGYAILSPAGQYTFVVSGNTQGAQSTTDPT